MLDEFNVSVGHAGGDAAVSTRTRGLSVVNVVVTAHSAVTALATALIDQLVTIVVDELPGNLRSVIDKVVFDTDSNSTGTVGEDVLAARGLSIQLYVYQRIRNEHSSYCPWSYIVALGFVEIVQSIDTVIGPGATTRSFTFGIIATGSDQREQRERGKQESSRRTEHV
jgi:hypothetical protein